MACQHAKHEIVRFEARNGALHYCEWCFECDRNVTHQLDRISGKANRRRKHYFFSESDAHIALMQQGRQIADVRVVVSKQKRKADQRGALRLRQPRPKRRPQPFGFVHRP